jgi:hypothetical protein
MKRLMIVVAVAVLACLAFANVQASVVTLSFDPNALIDLYPTDSSQNKAVQPDARRIHMDWGTDYYGTFNDYLEVGHSQPTDYNTYVNWRNSLVGPNDGIAVFNSWLIDGGNAQSWGEKHLVKPDTTVSATSVDGWSYRIIHNPYGPSLPGDVVQWYTLDPTKRLRPGGADIGNFTMTADLFLDNNTNGVLDAGDTEVNGGDTLRMWFGNLNGDDAPFYRSDTQALYFNGAIYSNSAGNAGSGFEAVLEVGAIPEPTAIIIWALFGALGLAVGYWRRK